MHRLTFVVLCFVVTVWARAQNPKAQEAKAKGQKGGTQFNDADLDTVLSNPRILVNYVKCFIGEVSCTKEGRDIKGESFQINLIDEKILVDGGKGNYIRSPFLLKIF